MKTININGKTYPFLCSCEAMEMIEETTGLSLFNMSATPPMKLISAIAINCINAGYEEKGVETRLDDNFKKVMGFGDVPAIMEAFTAEFEKKPKRKVTK
jgi:hypothetical protein